MTLRTLLKTLILAGAMPAVGGEVQQSGTAELMQLNRANEQVLERIQRDPDAAETLTEEIARRQADRDQLSAQRRLQEQQRRALLLQHERARYQPWWRSGPEAIDLQRNFRLQQQYQLNRFPRAPGR